jgi:Mitochondrial biogenesis AIM24
MAGLFGGEGFILQRLSGDGSALVKSGGASIEHTLAPGETLRATTGSVVAFETTVEYDVVRVQGVKNILFSREGLFLASFRGKLVSVRCDAMRCDAFSGGRLNILRAHSFARLSVFVSCTHP